MRDKATSRLVSARLAGHAHRDRHKKVHQQQREQHAAHFERPPRESPADTLLVVKIGRRSIEPLPGNRSGGRRPIFYDEQRVRWRFTRRTLEVSGVLLTLLLVYFCDDRGERGPASRADTRREVALSRIEVKRTEK